MKQLNRAFILSTARDLSFFSLAPPLALKKTKIVCACAA
jgi:hypothetical protein